MSTPTVAEIPARVAAGDRDPFIDDLVRRPATVGTTAGVPVLVPPLVTEAQRR
jgi:hypothetical protein